MSQIKLAGKDIVKRRTDRNFNLNSKSAPKQIIDPLADIVVKLSGANLPNNFQFELHNQSDRFKITFIAENDEPIYILKSGSVCIIAKRDIPIQPDHWFADIDEQEREVDQLSHIDDAIPAINLLDERVEDAVKNAELSSTVDKILKIIEKKADIKELSAIWKACESQFAHRKAEQDVVFLGKEIGKLTESLSVIDSLVKAINVLPDNYSSKSDLITAINQLQKSMEDYTLKSELVQLVNTLSKTFSDYTLKSEAVGAFNVVYSHLSPIKLNSKTITISADKLKDLKDNPIELAFVSEGSNLLILDSLCLKYSFESTAYTIADPGDKLSVQYETSGEIVTVDSVGFLDQVSNQQRLVVNRSWNGPLPCGEKVILTVLNNNFTLGDGTLEVKFFYTVKTI